MFDNVVVGVDGRDGGWDAIALARQLAAPGAAITLAHVYGVPTAAGRAAALALPFELEAAERVLAVATGRSNLSAQPTAVYETSISRGLHRCAEERRADLLVVGSCHRGPLGRTFMGDETSHVMNGAPCAVAVAPRGHAVPAPSTRLMTIGVGADHSVESARALDIARELASRDAGRVKALAVVSLEDIPPGDPIPDDWPQLAAARVADELHRLAALDGVDGDALYGDPGEELAKFSRELDLLIVGSRGYGPVGRLFHGSVSRYLLGHVACPLLLLPRSVAGSPELGMHAPQVTPEELPV